jgi:Glycosyl transferase family 11
MKGNKTSSTKTIIFTHGGGRFGNQIFSYAHLLAFAFEYEKFDLVNISFWEYADLLAISEEDYLCTKSLNSNKYKFLRLLFILCKVLYIKNDSIAKRIIIYLLYFYGGNSFSKHYHTQSITTVATDALVAQKKQRFNLTEIESFDLLNNADMTFLSGWDISSWQLVEKYQDKIREFLRIHQKYVSISNTYILEQRQKYDFIIGVMIRQGDYQLWENGQYYFTTQQYDIWLETLSEVFEHKGKIGFVIASDTPQNPQDFSHNNVHFTTGIAGGNGHYLESLVELSLCDLILSTPSTFSMWAAFVGNVPIMPLLGINQEITEDNLLQNHLFDFMKIDVE